MIKPPIWDEASNYTWDELSDHRWIDLPFSLVESTSDMTVSGVRVERGKTTAETITEMPVQGVRIEYSPIIMEQSSVMTINFVISKRDYRSDMLSYLPLYERKSSQFDAVMTGYDNGFKNLEQRLEVSERNLFIDSAVESLPVHEKDFGLTPENELNYQQRREQISSRSRASLEQTTEESIKNVAIAFNNGEIEINKTDIPGVFQVRFTGIGIPDNLKGFMRVMDIIMPAHLEISYVFTFNTWDMVSEFTWDNVSNMTWNDLRENEVS